MDDRILEIVQLTSKRLGLENYYLHTYKLYEHINIFNETNYTLVMEWYPNNIVIVDDDLNPEGTAVIEIDIHSKKITSIIFVGEKNYADGIIYNNFETENIIEWIERETGLTYGEQFQLDKQEERELHFKSYINDILVSPSGLIKITFDEKKRLTSFCIEGKFPNENKVEIETYTLSLEKLNNKIIDQFELVKFPSYDDKKLQSLYGINEFFVTNDLTKIIPVSLFEDDKPYVNINKIISWETPLTNLFERKEVMGIKEVSLEKAFTWEPSQDSLPILNFEQEECLESVKIFLRQQYSEDSGKWELNRLYREQGYIYAILRTSRKSELPFQRKITVIIDPNNFEVLNYIDNEVMLQMFEEFQLSDEINMKKEEAYEKLKPYFELIPYYVYDFTKEKYVLCGKVDCQYGVDAYTGEIKLLNELTKS